MSAEAGNVEGDELDRDGDSLGAREVVGGRLEEVPAPSFRVTWQAGQLRSSVEPA